MPLSPRSFARFQNLPRLWTRSRNVVIVPDASKSREQFNRNIKNQVGAVIALLFGEKSIAYGLHFRRDSAACFEVFDVLLGVMENRPALNTIYPRTGIAVH